MERNRLVYAMSDRALVVHGRYREGGTWAGATDALRRGLTNVFVRSCPEPWAGAMRALGARPVSRAEDFLSDPIDVGVEKLLYAPA
jgi:predicted Rossmann fold nucleotide-binding protein DprA/Smf involved in DNA uptake